MTISKSNQHGPSIINDTEKINIIISEAKTMSQKEMLQGSGTYKISKSVIRRLIKKYDLKFGYRARNGNAADIKQVYKYSTKAAVDLYEKKKSKAKTAQEVFYSETRLREKAKQNKNRPRGNEYEKERYNSLTNEQLKKKRKSIHELFSITKKNKKKLPVIL